MNFLKIRTWDKTADEATHIPAIMTDLPEKNTPQGKSRAESCHERDHFLWRRYAAWYVYVSGKTDRSLIFESLRFLNRSISNIREP